MITRFILLFFVLVLASSLSFSQKGYEYGTVITNKNDTIQALIKDRGYGIHGSRYKKIRVKDGGLIAKRYSPYDIKSYSVGNDMYESVWLSSTLRGLREVFVSERNQGKKHFLKVVVSGTVSLYYWEIRDYESGTNDYIELIKRKHQQEYIRASQGIFGLKTKRLAEYFSDCSLLVEKLNANELKNAVDVVNFYNSNCVE